MVSFKNALRPVFGFSKILGLYPYGESGRFKTFLRFYSIAVIFTFVIHRLWYYTTSYSGVAQLPRNGNEFFMNFLTIFPFAIKALSSASVLSPLYFMIWHPDKMQKIYSRLDSFTECLGTNSYSGMATGAFVVGIFGSSFLQYVVSAVLEGTKIDEFIFYFFYWGLMEIMIAMTVASQFCVLLEVSVDQLRKLNRLTQETSELEKCVETHYELCTLVREIRDIYSLPAFILTLSCTDLAFTTVQYCWYGARNLNVYCDASIGLGSLEKLYGLLANSVSYVLPRAVHFWTLCHYGYEVFYESDVFSDFLCRAMRSWHHPCYSKKLLAYVAVRPSVSIRVWDLYPLHTTLLFSCFFLGFAMFVCWLQTNIYYFDDGSLCINYDD